MDRPDSSTISQCPQWVEGRRHSRALKDADQQKDNAAQGHKDEGDNHDNVVDPVQSLTTRADEALAEPQNRKLGDRTG